MSNIHLLRPRILLLIVLGLCGSAAARAQCPTGFFYADLRANFFVNLLSSNVSVISPLTPSAIGDCLGWYEMVVKINIPADCTAAIIDTDYEGAPRDWTLNIGDSSTNDGFAGGAPGTTAHNAELWILNETLSLANAGSSPAFIDNPLVHNHISPTDSAMKFLIKNQFVSWGQPYQFTQSPNNRILFAIPDTTVPPADQRSIYAGFNRVIFNAVANGRRGCGLRTAVIRFQ